MPASFLASRLPLVLYPSAIPTTQHAILEAIQSCLDDHPCGRFTIDTKERPPCVDGNIHAQVVLDRIRHVSPPDWPGCCHHRTLVNFDVVIDVPRCAPDEYGLRPVDQAIADTEATTAALATILWGLNHHAKSGKIVDECSSVDIGDMTCVGEGDCWERYRLPVTVDLTGWCPPGDAVRATPPRS